MILRRCRFIYYYYYYNRQKHLYTYLYNVQKNNIYITWLITAIEWHCLYVGIYVHLHSTILYIVNFFVRGKVEKLEDDMPEFVCRIRIGHGYHVHCVSVYKDFFPNVHKETFILLILMMPSSKTNCGSMTYEKYLRRAYMYMKKEDIIMRLIDTHTIKLAFRLRRGPLADKYANIKI